MNLRRRVGAIAASVAILAGSTGTAVADDIYNDLDDSIDAVAEEMPLNVGGDPGSTTLYVRATGEGRTPADGKSGCNLTGSSTLVVAVASSATSVATVSPSSVTFDSCGATRELTVTPVAEGTATISVTQTSNNTGGTFDFAPATFTVNVTPAAPANTAPSIEVTGVTAGATYAKGDVPAAMCEATDAEDGPSSFPATLSAITGDNAVDGLGSQTASCEYTDAGDLSASSSVTYTIADISAPDIAYALTSSAPVGQNGWYVGDVSLVWTVTETQSPSTLVKTGCVDQSITTDQEETTYSCSATSVGGTATQVDVSIKRDATAPVVTGTVTSTPIDVSGVTWYQDNANVTWGATDSPSGVKAGSLSPTSSTFPEGYGQSASAGADDNAGNHGTGSVTGINVDASAPTVTVSIASTPAYDDGTDDWFKDGVLIDVSAADPDLSDGHAGSGLTSAPTTPVTRTESGSFSTVATDKVGHSTTSNSVSYKVDSAAPTSNITCPTVDIVKGSTASASWTAQDEASGSGLATPDKGSVPLQSSTVGTKTATAPAARDNVGHTSDVATCTYRVVFDFAGFFRPIDMGGVFNVAKAGSAIPVKFTLGGDQGLDIFETGYPRVTSASCPSSASLDTIEDTVTATTSGLKYDSLTEQYNYTWKTASSFAGSCRMLTVKLVDGTSQVAYFKFTK